MYFLSQRTINIELFIIYGKTFEVGVGPKSRFYGFIFFFKHFEMSSVWGVGILQPNFLYLKKGLKAKKKSSLSIHLPRGDGSGSVLTPSYVIFSMLQTYLFGSKKTQNKLFSLLIAYFIYTQTYLILDNFTFTSHLCKLFHQSIGHHWSNLSQNFTKYVSWRTLKP